MPFFTSSVIMLKQNKTFIRDMMSNEVSCDNHATLENILTWKVSTDMSASGFLSERFTIPDEEKILTAPSPHDV